MTVTQESSTPDSLSTFSSKFRQQPVYQILAVEISLFLIIALFDQNFLQHFPTYLALLIFTPLFPAIYAERKWNQLIRQNPDYTQLKEKADMTRSEFLLMGIIFSGIFFIIGQLHFVYMGNLYSRNIHYIFQDFRNETSIQIGRNFWFRRSILLTTIYFFVFTISTAIMAYKFNLTGIKQEIDSNKNKFYNHPFIMNTNVSYFLIGILTIPLVFYPFHPVNINTYPAIDFNTILSSPLFVQFNYMLFGLAIPVLIGFPLFIASSLAIHSRFMPYFLNGRKLVKNSRDRLLSWIGWMFATIAIFAITLLFMLPIGNTSALGVQSILPLRVPTYIGIIFLTGWTVFLQNKNANTLSFCEDCNYYGGEVCKYCEHKDIVDSPINSLTKPPRCPNCKELWNNLSRRCSNCQYTIVLTCDNCSNTINPLWKKCNLCDEPRQSVPEIALGEHPDNRFQYTRARYLTILLSTLPLVIIEIITINQTFAYYNQSPIMEFSPIIARNLYTNDDLRRILAWFIFMLAILILIYRASTSGKKSHVLLVDGLFRLTYSEMIILALTTMFVIRIVTFISFILFGIEFGQMIFLFIVILIFAAYAYLTYRNLKNYDPVIIIDKSGGL